MNGLPRKTLFVDRNSGGKRLQSFLVAADIPFVLHDDIFKHKNTPDSVWLKKVGTLGYAMVTGDIDIENSYIFLSILTRSVSHVFILRGLNHASAEGRAQCIIKAYPEIVRLCFENTGPRLWKTDYAGHILPVDFKHLRGLLKRYGRTNK